MSASESDVLLTNLTETEIKELHAIFSLVDTDGGGSISPDELQILMNTVGLPTTKKELNKIIKEIDENGDGEIQFDEFVKVMSKKVSASYTSDEIIQSFKLFAINSPNGYISKDELKIALTEYGDKISNEKLNNYINSIEFDNNGLYNYEHQVNFILND
mmetsp:Transcript_18488/g.22766  ORF Transcript_18488/g.22766 Transcript_18488/m.22766 type:complete len:159 (+) Transcript_18488:53-529(+)